MVPPRIMIDTHVHTYFSFDSDAGLDGVVESARALGLEFLAVTDHVDFLYSGTEFRMWDKEDFFFQIARRKEYAPFLVAGVEAGYTKKGEQENAALVADTRFGYVINSVHEVGTLDPYFPEYFIGKDRLTAYSDYLTAVRASLDAPYYYSTVGHLGYVTRKSPYPVTEMDLETFGDAVDDILLTIIRKDKILEVNSAAYRHGGFMPDREILARYRALGGKLVTFASDAHSPAVIGNKYAAAVEMLSDLGFTEWAVTVDRKIKTFAF